MKLYSSFKKEFGNKLLERTFIRDEEFYVKAGLNVSQVIALQQSTRVSKNRIFFRCKAGLTYTDVLSCRKLKFNANLMHNHFSKTLEGTSTEQGWIILDDESDISSLVDHLIKELDNKILPELDQYMNPDFFFNYLVTNFEKHPLFSNEMTENLFCFTKIYKYEKMFEVVNLALKKVGDRHDEKFLNDLIKEMTMS